MMMMAVVATIVMIVMTSHHSLPIRIDQKGTCLGKTQTQAAAIARVVEDKRGGVSEENLGNHRFRIDSRAQELIIGIDNTHCYCNKTHNRLYNSFELLSLR